MDWDDGATEHRELSAEKIVARKVPADEVIKAGKPKPKAKPQTKKAAAKKGAPTSKKAASKKKAAAAIVTAPGPQPPKGVALADHGDWWQAKIAAAEARHSVQRATLNADQRDEMSALKAGLAAAASAAVAAAEVESFACDMCKRVLPEDEKVECVHCENSFCDDCAHNKDHEDQCVDCYEDGEFNCCAASASDERAACHGQKICEECIQKHKSGGNRGRRKGFTPDGCNCMLNDDDY